MRSTFLLVSLAAYAIAFPLEDGNATQLEKRNACDNINFEPVLYHHYGPKDCPPKHGFAKEGWCADLDKANDYPACTVYSEDSTF